MTGGYVEIPGSGLVRVTTAEDVRAAVVERQTPVSESAFQSQISDFWANLSSTGSAIASPQLAERVWVANRCMQLNAQQIASMPLRFYGGSREPAWVSNPDPVWFPNGVGDAVFAAAWSMYAYGDAFLYVTSRYASGYPSAWTVLDPSSVTIDVRSGVREYQSGNVRLARENVVQVSRDPKPGATRGTAALRPYGGQAYGLLGAQDLGQTMMGSGGIPRTVLKSQRKLREGQAQQLQLDFMEATARRGGAPAVLPPEIDFQVLSFNPKDLLLVDVQKFNAQAICSAYGVPSQFFNLPPEGGLNYTTPVLAMEDWWRRELRPMANKLDRALSAQMLPAGQSVGFDSYEAVAPAFQDLVPVWVSMVEKGLVSPEEFRAAVLGLPPQSLEENISDLLMPASAGASPAQQTSSSVVALRPTQAVSG